MEKLSDETIIYILDYFLDKSDRFIFAITSEKTWRVAKRLSLFKNYVFEDKANALDIQRTTHLIISDRFYNKEFITHFLNFATNINSVHFVKKNTYPVAFVKLFLSIKKKCNFIVSAKNLAVFQVVIEEAQSLNLTVEANLEKEVYDELVKTPEELQKKLDVIKRVEKIKYYEKNNGAVLMKTNLNHLNPSHVNRLCNVSNYVLYEYNNKKMMMTTNETETNLLIKDLCPTFVEFIVILDNYWFLCSSFSVFVHDNKQVDVCADDSKVGYQENPVAFIRKKTRAGSDYFELTMRLGNLELLATSGFFDNTEDNDIGAFFGSSVSNLPKIIIEKFDTSFSKDIFVASTAQPFANDARLLNQYMKKHSAAPWMFISLKFKEKGYEPFHPLSFNTENKIQATASLILNVFSKKIFLKEEIAQGIDRTQNLPDKSTISGKLVMQYIKDLSCKTELGFDKYDRLQVKKDMLVIYEGVLAGAIKNKNRALANKAEEEYKPPKNILFD